MSRKDRQQAERAEALDPATPAPRLAALMGGHLADVLRNPALPLLLLEQPDLWRHLEPQAMQKLAASERCPPGFAAWVLRQPKPPVSRTLLVFNRALPAALRREAFLASSASDQLSSSADSVAEYPHLSDFLEASESALLARAAGGGPLHEEDHLALVAMGEVGQTLSLQRPNCPAPALRAILERGGSNTASRALRHPGLAAADLAAALDSDDAAVRHHARRNPAMTPAQFDAQAATPEGRLGVALNRALPEAMAERLAIDPDKRVRLQLTFNPSLSAASLAQLARDADPSVRFNALQRLRPGKPPR